MTDQCTISGVYQELLANYAKELDCFFPLTVAGLIDSHRRQREIVQEQRNAINRSEAEIRKEVEARVRHEYQLHVRNALDLLKEASDSISLVDLEN